jgi:hypothetical protein
MTGIAIVVTAKRQFNHRKDKVQPRETTNWEDHVVRVIAQARGGV